MRILRKHDAELKRYTSKGGYNEDGEWVEGTTQTTTAIKCCIQPVFNLTRQLDLPEGVREKDCRVLWTHEDLVGSSEVGSVEADIIIYQGKEYEVHDTGDWNGGGRILATEAVIVRRDKL